MYPIVKLVIIWVSCGQTELATSTVKHIIGNLLNFSDNVTNFIPWSSHIESSIHVTEDQWSEQ